MDEHKLQNLRSIELARIKKWEDNLKKVKRETMRQQAGLDKKSAEEIKRGIIGGKERKISSGSGNGAKGNNVHRGRKRDSKARMFSGHNKNKNLPI